MTVERKDLTRAQADELIRNIRLQDPNANLDLVDQGDGRWTVRINSAAPAGAAAAVGAPASRAGRTGEPGVSPPMAAPTPGQDTEPPWLGIARGQIGVMEVPGQGSNPVIESYLACTTAGALPDDVPWCGAFVSFCLARAGVIDRGSARAADWLNWGRKLDAPRPGSVVILKPQSPGASGHVGFWVGEQGAHVLLLGGNQGDEVKISRYPLADVRGYRWPI